jgi:hypothetical protein
MEVKRWPRNLQFATAYHIRYNENEPVATEGKKNAGLVENPPHLGSDVVYHVLPTIRTWVELLALL